MSRPLRTILPGVIHHVIQRGNNGQTVFRDDEDSKRYLELMRVYAGKSHCSIVGYCLMSNHVHILVRAGLSEKSIGKMMHGINVCFAKYIGEKYEYRGHLWGSRFLAYPVEDGEHLWTVSLYIDQNPCKAGLCKSPEEYAWSSARAHFEGRMDTVLNEILFEGEDAFAYKEEMGVPCSENDVQQVERHAQSGWPMGGKAFVARIEKQLGRLFRPSSQGRPRKHP